MERLHGLIHKAIRKRKKMTLKEFIESFAKEQGISFKEAEEIAMQVLAKV